MKVMDRGGVGDMDCDCPVPLPSLIFCFQSLAN